MRGAADQGAVPGEARGAAPGNALEASDEPAAASARAAGTALCASEPVAVQALAWVYQLIPFQQFALKMACHLAAGRRLAGTAAQELP